MKIMIFIFSLLLVLVKSTTSTNVHCTHTTEDSYILKNAYICVANDDFIINSVRFSVVTSTTGTHQNGKTNDDVKIFWSKSKNIDNFPQGLEKIFKNLIGIQIQSSRINKISQTDLKSYPNLVQLFLYSNQLEILEVGTFDYNTKLESLSFYNNRIFHIDSNVFTPLHKLANLWLGVNKCIDLSVQGNLTAVQEIIKSTGEKCIYRDYLEVDQQLKEIEVDSKFMSCSNTAAIKSKLAKMEDLFIKSLIRSHLVIRQRIEAIKEFICEGKFYDYCAISSKLDSIDRKLTESSEQTVTRIDAAENKLKKSINKVEVIIVENHSKFDNLISKIFEKFKFILNSMLDFQEN